MGQPAMPKPRFNEKDLTLVWQETDAADFADAIQPEDVSRYSQAAHRRDTAGYDLLQNALCFEVLGGIIFAVGILFVFLSLKKRRNRIIGINTASLQFVVCLLGLIGGLALLIVGTVFLVKALRRRKAARRDIEYLGTLSRE